MAELVFILTDFFSAAPPDAGAGLPRLPLLETMLTRSRVTALAPDWRGWLAARSGSVPGRSLTPSATVAAAWQARPEAAAGSGQVWLATPVHYFAGLDSVHLHPAGLLRLDGGEQRRLVEDFAQVFAGSPWQLRALGQRELLLSGPAIEASGADPAYFAGSDPTAGLPRGAGAGTLRRLGAEMEMWLYEHPLNLERGRRGELPVTTLWLWGAGPDSTAPTAAAPAPGATAASARLYGRDTYAEALWRLHGGAAAALPAAFDAALLAAHADSVFLYPLLQPEGLTAALLQFEQRWLPGALAAVRQRRASVLRLLIGPRAYSVRWIDLARFWRGRRPWWERLA
ncbi:MAG TPA: hypothetical protein VHN17_12515 [Steroidobacteraceae bacterium]|nr:hypothetical protein [Steroidobacteraceae bacterium]